MHVLNRFNIDLAKKQTPIVINAMQNDVNSRRIEAHLFANSVPWDVPTDASASIAFKNLKDGHKGWYDKLPDGTSATTVNNNTVVATLSPAVLSSEGEVSAAIIFQDKQLNQIATFVFSIFVEPNPSDGESIVNDYYKYSTLEQVSEAVDEWLTKTNNEKNEFLDDANNALDEIREVVINSENAPAIICEETGRFVSVDNSSNRLLHGLNIYGKTTQDGTPTPENLVELVSAGASGAINTTVTAKNIFGGDALADKLVEVAGATKDEISGTVGFYGSSMTDKTLFSDFKPYTQYTFFVCGKNSAIARSNLIIWYTDGTLDDTNFSAIDTNELVIVRSKKGKTIESFAGYNSGGHTTLEYEKCGIFEGVLTEADFEPYVGSTVTASTPNGLPGIPVKSDGNYTDENGQQWICDEIDFAHGVYINRIYKYTFNGTETWYAGGATAGNAVRYDSNIRSIPGPKQPICLSSHFQYKGFNVSGMWVNEDYPTYLKVRIMWDFATADDLKAFLAEQYANGNPVTVQYILATPIETSLSAEEMAAFAALHSYKPTTTVYNDAGAGLAVEYVADTKNYIDQKLAAISAALLNA